MMLPLQMCICVEVEVHCRIRRQVDGIGAKKARPVCKVFTKVLRSIHCKSQKNKGNVGSNQGISNHIRLGNAVFSEPLVLPREILKLAHVTITIELLKERLSFSIGRH